MNTTFLVAVSVAAILAIILSIYYGTKKCCGSSLGKRLVEMFMPRDAYGALWSEEADAWLLQRSYLPASDTLTEHGGTLEELAGIEPSGSPYPEGGPFMNSNAERIPGWSGAV